MRWTEHKIIGCSKYMHYLTSFKSSRLWRWLRGIGLLRSSLYLAIGLREAWEEPDISGRDLVDRDLAERRDPWLYETNPLEQQRFVHQTRMIDASRGARRFRRGLEIGCAEGLFTEVLSQRCESLRVLDLSPTALARTRARRCWPSSVTFAEFDLRLDPIPGQFDLIVVAGILEYFTRPGTMARVREKLVEALEHGGCLLVETTRSQQVVEDSWWGRYLIRGKWINDFFSRHPSLSVESDYTDDMFVITMLRRVCPELES